MSKRLVYVLSPAMIVLGVAVLIRTAAAGGGSLAVGYLFGLGLSAAGVLRLWIARKTAR